MSKKELPSIEVFAVEQEELGRPIAISMDPDQTDRERLRLIVRAQIDRDNPKTIFCNIGGVYDVISSSEISAYHNSPEEEKRDYTEQLIEVFKGPYTSDIIISDPPPKT